MGDSVNSKQQRDELRARFLGSSPKRESQTLHLDSLDCDVEVRSPTVRQRADILKAAGVDGSKGTAQDAALLQVTTIIKCCYVPGTEHHLFDDADAEVLQGLPAGSWIDDLSEVAMKLLNVDTESKKKRSAATQNDSSSSA